MQRDCLSYEPSFLHAGSRSIHPPERSFYRPRLPPYSWLDFRPDRQIAPVLPDLFIGSQDVAQDLRLLKDTGITHVVNLATAVPNYYDFDLTYKRIDVRDCPTANLRQHFEEVFRFIDDARHRGGRVLVHCNAGISRAATICIGYLMSRLRMRYDEAFGTVKQARPIICPNEGFRRQLREYDVELFGLGPTFM